MQGKTIKHFRQFSEHSTTMLDVQDCKFHPEWNLGLLRTDHRIYKPNIDAMMYGSKSGEGALTGQKVQSWENRLSHGTIYAVNSNSTQKKREVPSPFIR